MARVAPLLPIKSTVPRLAARTFREVLAQTLQALRPLAVKLAGSPADAEDLLQATCLRALESEHRLQDHSNIPGWLCRIMRNLQIDICRTRARRITLCESHLVADPAEQIPLWRVVEDQEVGRLVPTLSAHLQVVWRLHHEEGLDQNEIAARLAIPRATVATRVFRARLVMRQALLQLYGHDFDDVSPGDRSAIEPSGLGGGEGSALTSAAPSRRAQAAVPRTPLASQKGGRPRGGRRPSPWPIASASVSA